MKIGRPIVVLWDEEQEGGLHLNPGELVAVEGFASSS